MVEVDVFWAYGWGASLAGAAGRQLKREPRPLESKYFVATVLFLALVWAPTGMLLLLRHPSWETMQVAPSMDAISEWLVLGFGITNITQGILGFWVSAWLLRKGNWHAAQLNWIAGYFGMFFILLYGWDGLGYDRFLYDRDMISGSPAWVPGAGIANGALPSLLAFLKSSVAKTLYLDGVYLLPPFFFLTRRWARDGRNSNGEKAQSLGVGVGSYLAGVFVVGFGAAAIAALTVRGIARLFGITDHVQRALGDTDRLLGAHVASYLIGLPIAAAGLWWLALNPRGVANRVLRPLSPAAHGTT